MTPATILERIEADVAFWRERVNEADDDTYGRLAAQSRVEALSTLLSWLPKELDRLVVAVRAEEDEEPCCDTCDETRDHEPPCVLRSNVTSYEVARELAMERSA